MDHTCIVLYDSRCRAATGKRYVHIMPDAPAVWRYILDAEFPDPHDPEREGYAGYTKPMDLRPDDGEFTLKDHCQAINDFWNMYGWDAEPITDADAVPEGWASDTLYSDHR